MRTLLKVQDPLLMFWLMMFTLEDCVFSIPIQKFQFTEGARQTSDDSSLEIPSISRLLTGFKQDLNPEENFYSKITNAAPATPQHQDKTRYNNWKNPMSRLFVKDPSNKNLVPCKNNFGCLHEILHSVLPGDRQFKLDGPLASMRTKDLSKNKGSFRISDGAVHDRKGDYSISPGRVKLGVNMPGRKVVSKITYAVPATQQHQDKTRYNNWKNPMSRLFLKDPPNKLTAPCNNTFGCLHDILHNVLPGERQFNHDGSLTDIKPNDFNKINGSYRISDGAFNGKGDYSISPGRVKLGVNMPGRNVFSKVTYAAPAIQQHEENTEHTNWKHPMSPFLKDPPGKHSTPCNNSFGCLHKILHSVLPGERQFKHDGPLAGIKQKDFSENKGSLSFSIPDGTVNGKGFYSISPGRVELRVNKPGRKVFSRITYAVPATQQHQDRVRYNYWKLLMSLGHKDPPKKPIAPCNDNFGCLHEILNSVLHGERHVKHDGTLADIKAKDFSENTEGTFRISDEAVNGKGKYSISPNSVDIGVNMRINSKQGGQTKPTVIPSQSQGRPTFNTPPSTLPPKSPTPSSPLPTTQTTNPVLSTPSPTSSNVSITSLPPTTRMTSPTQPPTPSAMPNPPGSALTTPKPSPTSSNVSTPSPSSPPTTRMTNPTQPPTPSARPNPPGSALTTPKMCLVPCNTTRPPGLNPSPPTVPPSTAPSLNSTMKPSTLNCLPTQFEEEALNIHNRYRAIHNAPAMTLNCEMSKNAAAFAQKLAGLDTMINSAYNERPEQGENLSLGCNENREETAEEAIKLWFDEVCEYIFGKEGPQSGTNHFTQLVWKASTELGIGKATNKQPNGATCTFIVARYKPQGNLENDNDAHLRNVEKGAFDDAYCRNVQKAGLDGGYGFRRFQLGVNSTSTS